MRVPVRLYFASLGGDSPVIFWSLFLGGMTLVRLLQSFQAWYLGYWASQYETHDPAEVDAVRYVFMRLPPSLSLTRVP